jgi:hypothetical protein
MPPCRIAAPFAGALTCLVFASTPAIAMPIVQSGAGDRSTTESVNVTAGTVVADIFESQRTPVAGATADLLASGGARIGSLSAASTVRAAANSRGGQTFSVAGFAGWADRVRIDAPGLTNQVGILRGSIVLDGILAVNNAGGTATAEIAIALLNSERRTPPGSPPPRLGFDPLPSGRWTETNLPTTPLGVATLSSAARPFPNPFFGEPPGSGPTLEFQDVSIGFALPFVFGQEFDTGFFMRTLTRITTAGNGLDNFAIADFASTLNWGGISQILLGDTVLTEFSITTQSGFDLRRPFAAPGPGPGPNPVPEPATWLLLATALLALAWTRGPRRAASMKLRV